MSELFTIIYKSDIDSIVTYLEKEQVDLENVLDKFGNTAFNAIFRSFSSPFERAEILIKHQVKIGKNPSTLVNSGKPPAICYVCSVEELEFLLKYGANIKYCNLESDSMTRSPVCNTCFGYTKSDLDLLKALIKHGAIHDFYFPFSEYSMYNSEDNMQSYYADDSEMIQHFHERRIGYFNTMKYLINEHNYDFDMFEESPTKIDDATFDLIYDNLNSCVVLLRVPSDIQNIIRKFLGIDRIDTPFKRRKVNFERLYKWTYGDRFQNFNNTSVF